ncbi:MAG: CoA pyrophosphatase [Bacteroidota bacterium]|nr:CoA pyrophosphatase [Bacteroidota bacterium]
MFESLILRLKQKLQEPLPGLTAHVKMVPPGRAMIADNDELHAVRESAVLVLLYPKHDNICFCLIKRPMTMRDHAGQYSFPGGKYEQEDTSYEYTALREAREEIGIKPGDVQILGRLSKLYLSVSKFHITPILAFMHSKPEFIPHSFEVDSILELPLDILSDENKKTVELKTVTGMLSVPCYYYRDEIIWGATAMILAELETLLN